ncbi:hypothetical protein V1525DRAFT_424604 [Lipomyces kononenkoae]|uniref:Uncharacterized protein n=1 Tax=Lipomyces kononenkoae TaxID=34357 RepID=A0ACC3T953_LIPKO
MSRPHDAVHPETEISLLDPQRDVAVVTGGSSGLGYNVAVLLATRGVKVAILDAKEPDIRAPSVKYYKCDVGSYDEVAKSIARINRDLGPVTILVNNAGIERRGRLWEMPVEDIQTTINVNLMAHFYTIRCVVPAMISASRGCVVSIGSSLCYTSPIFYGPYGASKAGLLGLYETLRVELSQYPGIRTLFVLPGQMRTPMFKDINPPWQFFAPVVEPRDLATEIVDKIARGKSGEIRRPIYVHGMPYLRILPWPVQKLLRWASNLDGSVIAASNKGSLDTN